MNSTSPATSTSSASHRWGFLIVISLGLLMISIDNSILYTALPQLTRALEASALQSLWIINAYPLILSSLLLGSGTLGDKVGHRRMFSIGLVIFGLASLAAALAPNAWALIAARAFLGLAAAIMMPATLALIRHTFPDERERNIAIGIWGSIAVTGAAAGPVVGGFLLGHFYWGSVFLINLPIVLIAFALTQLMAPANQPQPHKRWDVISSLYSVLALGGLTATIKELAHGAYLTTTVAFLCAAMGATLFVRRQRVLDDPLLTFDIFRSRIFAGGVLAAFGGMFTLVGIELLTTQKLQLADAATPLQAGLAIALAAVSAIPFSITGGAVLHRVGFLPLIAGGFTLIACAVFLGAWATGSSSGIAHPVAFYLSLALVGAGAGTAMSVSSTAIIGAAPVHRTGMAAGVEEVSYEFGTLISVALAGSLLPAFLLLNIPAGTPTEVVSQAESALTLGSTNPVITAAITQAYVNILWMYAAVAALFAALTAWAFKHNPKSGSKETLDH